MLFKKTATCNHIVKIFICVMKVRRCKPENSFKRDIRLHSGKRLTFLLKKTIQLQ